MTSALATLCLLLLAGTAMAVCPQGQTGKAPNCKDCPPGTTTAKSGDNLPCNLCDSVYSGKPPNCKWCGSFSSTIQLPGGINKCACIEGYTGTHPKCTSCPPGSSTTGTGNGLPCKCIQKRGEYFDSQYNCAKCDNTNGWYKPLMGFWPDTLKPAPKNVCVRCAKTSDGAMNVTSKGVKYCGCDTKKKYGFQGTQDGLAVSQGFFCIKCTGPNQVLDSKGRCMCKKGYGISKSPFDYCMPCGDKSSSLDAKGFCKCKPGYAFTSDGAKCVPCGGQAYEQQQGKCQCRTGYHGYTASWIKPNCAKCAAGQSSEIRGGNPESVCFCKDPGAAVIGNIVPYEKGCFCRWGFQQKKGTTACEYNNYCKSGQYVMDFWSGSALPKGWDQRSFPISVIRTPATARQLVKAKSLSWVGKQASLPKGVDVKLYVARIRRCLCVQHDDFGSRFTLSIKVAGGANARVEIDGGASKTDRCAGEYYDQNACLRPRVTPLSPTGTATTKGTTIVFPQYEERAGGWLSGFDYIISATNYKACHNVTVLLWSKAVAGQVEIKLPAGTLN